ncbi:uncharacterized protein N7477_004401 [Penicillium maclennaniae]|uniref:uncharacterized protein n=1 Tax=Penicillium maclennaniae TaxID=1343394 RepID=UPI00254112FE|nr:uncharacterized protein N7477_004401 [Penicillium maclennaniae]KAJ5674467.1 hypothetical protein N7477_004401 [Penicillium maclennaniae]
MGDLKLVQEAFDAAGDFLSPVLNREEIQKSQGRSLLEILNRTSELSRSDDGDARSTVIYRALDILHRIHTAFVTPVGSQSEPQPAASSQGTADLEDAKRRRILHALLDLISLEGIYPSLSSGVGIPLQQRVISVLPAGVIAKQAHSLASSIPHDKDLLQHVMTILLNILLDSRPSIQPVIRGRILSDIISGAADLAFNPNLASTLDQTKFQDGFAEVIDQTASVMLLPTLSNFLQSDTTPWFKAAISSQISRVPLRSGGVLQTIMFIASQFAPSLGQEAQTELSAGPHFTVQAIMQISRLLSSVPLGVEPVSYFTAIAPQLLTLLDGPDPDLKKTVSYAIGNGILGKRAYGVPGTIGHSIFLEPLFGALTAELNDVSERWMVQSSDMEGSSTLNTRESSTNALVNGSMVNLAIKRLESLALQHPNPGLVKRIVYPILLPLWGLACYAKEHDLTDFHERIMALLKTYFGISVGVQPLKKLVDHLLWDGGSTWTYFTEPKRQIALTRRTKLERDRTNIIKLIDSLQCRTDLFVSLLGSDPSSEERTGDIFLYVSERWLVQPQISDNGAKTQKLGESDDVLQKLISAKLAEKLLDNFKDTLSRRPMRVLELIKQVIDGELRRLNSRARQRDHWTENVSLSSLSNIVSGQKEQEDTSDKESSESLSTAFSLLSTVLASPEFSTSQETKPLLESVKSHLDQLIPLLSPAMAKPATTSSMLLEIQLTSPEHDGSKPTPSHVADLETHRQALVNLNSNLPPVQAEGFSLLSKLIISGSPVLDIPSTLTLLLSVITDMSESTANEEFIYLNAIKLIGTLASRHPRTVMKTLVDSYIDKKEQRSLDSRLRLGESLLRTVQDLGDALTGDTAKILGDGMVALAGRRGHRPETQKGRKEQLEKEQRRKEREERKQKEAVLPAGCLKRKRGDDSDTESPEQVVHAANIVAAWAAGASTDEEPDDLRVRASALSILASAVQTNILGLGPSVVSSAVDLALATLTLEPAPESAILRRASVILLLDILKALDAARETRHGKDVGFGFSLHDDTYSFGSQDQSGGLVTVGNIPSMLRTLGFVETIETDSIVRGHLRALIESLEAWLEKSLMWGIGAQRDDEPHLEIGDRIAGLTVNPMTGRGDSTRPKIEEIE